MADFGQRKGQRTHERYKKSRMIEAWETFEINNNSINSNKINVYVEKRDGHWVEEITISIYGDKRVFNSQLEKCKHIILLQLNFGGPTNIWNADAFNLF